MYSVLDTRAGDKDPARIGKWPSIPFKGLRDRIVWCAGQRFNREIPPLLEFELDPDYGRDMPDLFKVQIPLFSSRLLDGLSSAGVRNLDLYDAVIRDPRDGKQYTDYKAVNIIGIVQCANMQESKRDESHPANLIAVPFDKFVIDEDKTGGATLFRLAESAATIVIHKKVRSALEPLNLSMVVFIPINEWSN